MTKIPKIALLIQTSRAYGRGILRGISSYVQSNRPWSIYHDERIPGDSMPEWLRRWKGDGIIGWLESSRLARKIARIGIPTVDVFGQRGLTEIPVVDTDECAVAHLAADHLLDCGFEHFAYCGFPGLSYSDKRCEHFAEYLRQKGAGEVHIYRRLPRRHVVSPHTLETVGLLDETVIAAWLRSLPKPVGLMACNDTRAQQITNACIEYGIAVPRKVGVIGVNNDEVLCNMCHPTLSSVQTDLIRVGHKAAAILDGLMRGRHPAEPRTLVKPLGVMWRESTRVTAFADIEFAKAVQFIREHACDGISVADVLQHVPVSRSTLIRRFMARFGRSPRAEIIRLQMQRVKDLLVHTDLPLTEIAHLAGFDYVESMCRLFKSLENRTPGNYRRELRIANNPERTILLPGPPLTNQ